MSVGIKTMSHGHSGTSGNGRKAGGLPLPLADTKPYIIRKGISAEQPMKIKAIVHEVEEGGYWAEVPAIPGCATQGESMDELARNLKEAIEGCLSIDVRRRSRTN